eukprot:GHRR01024585.1.p1 GENE.GHRR01024585.1~~GHRR01024585.1.p1  ORF type:complete len:163 (-),score=43.90 GHRR01024585.1:257-745(-)
MPLTAAAAAGVQLPPPDYDQLNAAMKRQCTQHNLQPTDYFLLKITQLYEMVVVRHGLMLVGQPFSGKSSVLTVLAAALTDLCESGAKGTLFNRVQKVVFNPKAVTMGQLYGEQLWVCALCCCGTAKAASGLAPNKIFIQLLLGCCSASGTVLISIQQFVSTK